jgi:hypothetical protein
MAAKKRSSATRKTGGRKSATKKSATKKSATKKSAAKKSAAKKSGGRKKSATKKRSGRRYSKGAERKVGETMHEMKRGKLRSGRSGKKVKSRKQAIAIGLSQARKRGAKVPRKKG